MKDEQHYTRIDACEQEHESALCECRLVRDEYGNVALYHCSLHAAAPELLAALEACLTRFEEDRMQETHINHPMALARAAIAKVICNE